jgi:carbon-monoxide dehydrogenase medium subunit
MRELREYFRPRSAEEAVDIKKRYGPQAVYLGGGSDLLVHRPRHVEAAIDIRHAGIGYVRQEDDAWVIGGGALLRNVEREAGHVAGGMLGAAVRDTAPWLIRNAATLAGNIANASPAADSVPALLALDAELVLLDSQDERVPVGDVLVGPHRTSLGDRLIREIRIPRSAADKRAAFMKHARSKSDIAQVNLAVIATLDDGVVRDVRIALGAVAPVAMRASRAESLLEGQRLSPELLRQMEETVRSEVQPISDWRASEEYRRRMSGVLARRALERIYGD